MKKFGKFMFGTLTIATAAAGAYYLYKTFIKKDSSDDFENFEDDFEDFDSEEETETREYVPINISSMESQAKENKETTTPEEDETDAK